MPIGVAAEAHRYLAEGGPANLAPAARVPLRHGAAHRRGLRAAGRGRPQWGDRPSARGGSGPDRAVGVLYYRAHEISGNTAFAHALADAIDATGQAVGVPVFAGSLRRAPDDLFEALGDARRPRRHRAGGRRRAGRRRSAGGDDEAWDVERIAALDIPVLQGLCLTSSRAEWEASDDGVTPLDSATQIAIPEFDGRIITAPFSFKEIDADGLPRYVADPERCARVAGTRGQPRPSAARPERREAGRAGALGVPHQALADRQRRRPRHPGLGRPAAAPARATPGTTSAHRRRPSTSTTTPPPGDALIHALIAAGGQDQEWLTAGQLTDAHVRITKASSTTRWTADVPAALRERMTEAWGAAPGGLVRQRRRRDRAGDRPGAGNVVLLIQPPRGFGENPVAIYHDPDLAPTPPLPGGVPLAGARPFRTAASAPRRRAPRQARLAGVAARQERRPVGRLRHRRGARQPAADLPVPGQRPGRGRAGQAPRPRHDRRPPGPADGARGDATATSPGSSSCSTSTPTSRRWTRRSCRRSAARSGS